MSRGDGPDSGRGVRGKPGTGQARREPEGEREPEEE
jgi:hypothetical protein